MCSSLQTDCHVRCALACVQKEGSLGLRIANNIILTILLLKIKDEVGILMIVTKVNMQTRFIGIT